MTDTRVQHDPSCADPTDPELLPVDIAVERLGRLLQPIKDSQQLPLREALGRILSSDILSPIDVPSYTNSAMDGYAINSSDIPANGINSLQVVGTSWAGSPCDQEVKQAQAVRIMTGGMMPAGTDTVVIQEHVEEADEGAVIRIDSRVEAGRNVRQAGEDVKQGTRVLVSGELLTPAHIGLIASLGIDRVHVTRRLRVAYFTTGDELRSLDEHAGQPLAAGELFDSNRYTLFGMLQRLGVEIVDIGIVRDDEKATRDALVRASSADVIITAGGISAGAADFVTRVFHELGEVAFWKLAMRPGRPLAVGRVKSAYFFGLPGNPVAVMVTFYEFVLPALKRLMGASQTLTPLLQARCLSPLKKSPGRHEYQRGILGRDEDGALTVTSTGKQGAGRLSSMVAADCLLVLPPGADRIEPGDLVEVRPFYALI